jgi:CheY-like chemotaxis protein
MTQDTRGASPSPAAARDTDSRSTADIEETILFLECGGRTSAQAFRAVTALLQRHESGRAPLFLIARHIERIDGSLTGFILGLEAILRTSTRPVLLGDPSGVAALVLASSTRDRRIRPLPLPAGAGKVLIVNPSPSTGSLLVAVLEAYGLTCTLLHTGIDARAAIAAERFDAVLLDLDLPGLQSYAVAEYLKARSLPPVPVAVTGNDEIWTLETCVRFGIRKIVSKPYSVAEAVGLIADAAAGRGR